MDFSRYNHHLFPGSLPVAHPKVSICFITYKHEDFIRESLDSILAQETNFDFEIIIGEDHSPDSTAQIVQEYAKRYPNKIKAYIRPQNIGAKNNFLHCFFDCRGEYIVHIEGDDFWTDPQKLQRQVEFLDSHPHASACFHNAQIIYEDNSQRPSELINPKDQKPWTQSQDFLVEKETWFMATAAVMMRRKFAHSLPEWFLHSKSGDIPLYVILAEQGPIGYLPEVMSVYRKNEGGISMTDHVHSEAFIKNRIFMYSKINEYTHKKYDHLIRPILQDYFLMRRECLENKGHWIKSLTYFCQATRLNPPKSFKAWKAYLKAHLMSPETVLAYLNFRSKLNQFLGR